jgi:hypothetical protein
MRGILATHVAFSHCYPPLIYYLTERSLFKKCPPPPTGKSLKKALSGVQVIRIFSEQQKVPRQWKKFMSSVDNKEELMKFIFSTWRKADPQLLKDVEVFLAHEEICHRRTLL